MRKIELLFLIVLVSVNSAYAQPTVSFTFDDGVTTDMPGYPFEQWNKMLLDNLDSANLKTVFFVKGSDKLNNKGQLLLKSWNDKGHKLANHTFSHPNYNNGAITFERFKDEFLTTDTIINKFSNHIQLFRFPYLKEGNTKEKVALFRALL